MKILLFTLEYPPFKGGIANYYGNLVSYWKTYLSLNRLKHNILKSDSPEDDIQILNNNKSELINQKLPFLKWLPSFKELNYFIRIKKTEHILVGHILPLGTVTWIMQKYYSLRGRKISYSVFFHGMDLSFACRTWLKLYLTRKIAKSADNLICTNSYVANVLRNILSLEHHRKIYVVNPGVDDFVVMLENSSVADLKKKFDLENKIVLFSLGRLVKRKGFDMVLNALPEINSALSNIVYIIAGTGPDEKYLRDIAEFKKLNNVFFLGELSERNKWTWYDICDIFIMPSRDINGDYEGFGIVYLEANMLEKPVIAGSSGGVNDAVVDGYNGLTVDPQDPHDIAKKVIELALDGEKRKKIGKQGANRVNNEFNWEKQIAKISKILNKEQL